MNDFVASSVCWTIATSSRTSPLRLLRVRADQPLDDLGLEHDVRQALGRPVVHRPGDLAPQVLLGAQDQPRDRRRTASRAVCRGRPRPRRRPRAVASGLADAERAAGVAGERIPEARRAPCACPRGRRPAFPSARRAWSASTSCAFRSRRRSVGRGRRRSGERSFSAAWARRCSWRVGLGASPGDEHSISPSSRVEARPASAAMAARERGRWRRGRRTASVIGSRVARRSTLSPPASGSSPGASRTRRPGSGR